MEKFERPDNFILETLVRVSSRYFGSNIMMAGFNGFLVMVGLSFSSYLIGASSEDDKAVGSKVPIEVKHCHDGDTCHILTSSGLWFNVRLAGIDAPEVGRYGRKKTAGQPYGVESRDALVEMVVGKKDMYMRQVDLDPYNRLVVELFVNTSSVNLKMLEMGFAERYQGKTKRLDISSYESAQTKAKQSRTGIWGVKDYVSPKLWRQEGKL